MANPDNSGIPGVLILALLIAVVLMLFLGLAGPEAVRF